MYDPLLLTQIIVSGILLGFVLSLVVLGLTLIYGMMNLVNFAHGELVMLGCYTAYWLWKLCGLNPLFSLPVCSVAIGLLGVLVYRLLIRRVLKGPMVAQMFSTFGLSIFLSSSAQFLWTPYHRTIGAGLLSGSLKIRGVMVDRASLVMGVVALAGFTLVYFFLTKTETGRAMQATAQDRQAASLMGIDSDKMFALAWGIAGACAGAAGGLLSCSYAVHPAVGFPWALACYVAVVMGGFGSVTGALLGGILVGLVQVVSAVFIGSQFKLVITYLLLVMVLLLRPQGLLGRR